MQMYALTHSDGRLVGLYTTEQEALDQLKDYETRAYRNCMISIWTPGARAAMPMGWENVVWYTDSKKGLVRHVSDNDPSFRNRSYGLLDVTRCIRPKKSFGFTFIGYRGNMGATERDVRKCFDALYFAGAYDAICEAPGAEKTGSPDYSFCVKVKNKYFDELVLANVKED